MKKSSLIFTFVISLLIVPLYIYAFNENHSLFWVIFIVDRIISPIIQSKFEKSFDIVFLDSELEDEENNESLSISKFLILTIILIIIGLGLIIYVLFKHPTLFIILMLGELMDNIAEKNFIKKAYTKN